MSNFGVEAKVSGSVDMKKIEQFARKASCSILVGFRSGQMHVPSVHKNAKTKKYDMDDIAAMEPIETSELAKMLHYGTSEIPARPFLEDGILSKKNELYEALRQESRRELEGEGANWDKVGTMAVGAVNELVRSDWYKDRVPNAISTIIAKEGGDTPLIDSGNLMQSLDYVVM